METKKIHKQQYLKSLDTMIITLEQHYRFVATLIPSEIDQNNEHIKKICINMSNRIDKAHKLHAWLCILKNDFLRSITHREKYDLITRFYNLQDQYKDFMLVPE